MIVTNDSRRAEKAKYLTTQAKDDSVYYLHHEIGYNYRLNNIQAALGVAQLSRLNDFVRRKKDNYRMYQTQIKGIDGLYLTPTPPYADNNHWMCALQVDKKIYGRSRDQLIQSFRKEGVEVRPLWHLNHEQKPYQGCQSYKIEKAQELLKTTLNIPSSVGLTKSEIGKVTGLLKTWKR